MIDCWEGFEIELKLDSLFRRMSANLTVSAEELHFWHINPTEALNRAERGDNAAPFGIRRPGFL
jgi:hypothetical protein